MSSSIKYTSHDTIAAEATPRGTGGISIIRLTGSQAKSICVKMFSGRFPDAGSHSYGKILDLDDGERTIDDIVISYFKEPRSYTGEDVVEISAHGNPFIVAEILNLSYRLGARPAEPGEFTMRAFLNGRMDLTEAEAVSDLIAASSRDAINQARMQLSGGIGRSAQDIKKLIAHVLVQCELELDFVEDDVALIPLSEKKETISEALLLIDRMITGYRKSRSLRKGVKTVIVGEPNVGKSSLFNALLGEERAIVTSLPGTTRDIVTGCCDINGVSFEIFDTAGLRDSNNIVEDEGIRRAIAAADTAELKIVVRSVDTASAVLSHDVSDPSSVFVMNKCDKGIRSLKDYEIAISALSGEGLSSLKERLYSIAVGDEAPNESTISRERHYHALQQCREALSCVDNNLSSNYPAEIIAEELRRALNAVNSLLGVEETDEILRMIFSDFCIGK